MSSLFRSSGPSVNNPPVPVSALRIQSSVQGKPIPFGYGQNRIAGNLLWYGDFTSTAVNNQPQGSGKGGSDSSSPAASTSYIYRASFAMGLCEGPIASVLQAWDGKTIVPLAQLPQMVGWSTGQVFGSLQSSFTIFTGSYSQSAWGYLVSLHPEAAINYRGQAYVGAGPMQLGSSSSLPNLSFETLFGINTAYAGVPDANPKDVVTDFLTNVHYGLGFPSARLGVLTTYSNYCIANGLVISPFYAEQREAKTSLRDITAATNSEPVWSAGKLTIVPYGDQTITANGATYTAPAAPVYAFGEDDFTIQGEAQAPVTASRTPVSTQMNSVKVEYLDRSNNYNPAIVEAKNDAAIQRYGLRAKNVRQAHMFALAAPAQLSAQLELGREEVRAPHVFTVGAKYILLDPMDIVSITDAGLGLSAQWVRIKEIQENSDFTLTITAEEYLGGTGAAPLYGQQANSGIGPNYNQAPGSVQTPLFFEPTAALAQELEVWMGVCGQTPSLWGGCDVWVSYDDITYRNVGRIHGPSRMGVLTGTLPAVTAATTGATIDQTSTLAVNLAQSLGQLTSGSINDVLGFNTLCWVDGEFIAYRDAVLTGGNAYNLTYLNRGGYASTIASHASGKKFARIDEGIFKLPYTQERIGSTIYVKLLSFNIWGGGAQGLSDVAAYAYVLAGTALASPLPDVQNFNAVYESNVSQLTWDEVKDFRDPYYEVRKGSDWGSGQILGRFAHPKIATQGDGTYQIKAYAQPVTGLQVYSANATQLVLTGTVLPLNVAASWDEFASTPPSGTYGGTAFWDGTEIRTSAAGDVYTIVDVYLVADIYEYGGEGNGSYEVPAAHQIDIGRAAPCLVAITWTFSGVSRTNNFFAYDPLFDVQDFFGVAFNQLVNVYPEIALSQDGVTFGPYQKYSAGTYNARKFKARMQLQTFDPTVAAFLTSFKFTVYAPTRTDHWAIILGLRTSLTNLTLPSGGSVLTFLPDTQSTAAAFNGGVSNPTRPAVYVQILNAQPGDIALVTSITLSGCTVQVTNGGVGVSRAVNILPEGY